MATAEFRTAIGAIAMVALTVAYACVPRGRRFVDNVKYIWDRVQDDRALVYANREVDRQINKVRGILTFDGILFVVLRLESVTAGRWQAALVEAAFIYLSLSVGLSLYLFYIRWPAIPEHSDFESEFKFTMKHIVVRTVVVNFAVTLAALAGLALASLVVIRHFEL